ncbi:galactose mutarotase-like enzyme [Devosia subaequoris]|uniref:Galactose mutarotase-like enzyme n=1 Tax=Devosia subaequoris TaxID=395930 RepID=A0A7W6NC83_9HYPH|nr:aldose 1-epimerase family protein [Devosia subaequoris]MBB4052648.1 galactose mutarotase-like enzyme [Devosia subaequoris]MCP1209804.1 aldose 1-epimerase family protein [Devosia subaequoris]
MQLTRIANDQITVDVAALGAEMQLIQTRDGRQWLWHGDAAYWTGRSPLLFPIVGKAPNDTVTVDGVPFQMSQHGFARRSNFSLLVEETDRCVYRLTASEASRAMYPFDFQLDVEHRVEGHAVVVSATVTNCDHKIMPFGIGFHPAFAWPLPGAEDKPHSIELDDGGAPALRRLSGGLVEPKALPSPFEAGRLTLEHSLFANDAMLFPEGAGAGLVYGPAEGPNVHFTWENLPNFALWTKPGAGFICLEPWHGTAAAVGGSEELSERPFTELLGAGATERYGFRAELRG